MSQEPPVQRPARERLVKACDKFGLPLNPMKSLVDAAVSPSVGWRVKGNARSPLPSAQEKFGNAGQNHHYHRSSALVGRTAATFRRPLGFLVVGWMKLTPSLLLEVLSCCALLPFAQTVISCSNLLVHRRISCIGCGVFRKPRNRVSC